MISPLEIINDQHGGPRGAQLIDQDEQLLHKRGRQILALTGSDLPAEQGKDCSPLRIRN